MPIWYACEPPKFLIGHYRTDEPIVSEYSDVEEFRKDCEDWELGCMRACLDEMAASDPDWHQTYLEQSSPDADKGWNIVFEHAVSCIGTPYRKYAMQFL